MAATNGMISGFYSAWIAARSTAGYPVGSSTTPDAPTVNTVYGAYRIKYPVSYTAPSTTIERAVRQGGQRTRGSRYIGITDLGTFDVVVDGKDETFEALVRGNAVDTSYNTSMTLTAGNTLLGTPPRFILGMSVGFTDTDNTTDYFLTYIWNNVYFTKAYSETSSQQGGTNPNPVAWTVNPDISSRTGWGALYSATGLSVIENTDMYTCVRDAYEMYLTTYIANGSATTFTLPFRSKSNDATGAAGNIINKAGVVTAVTSVNITTAVVTLAAAGSSGDLWTLLTPCQYLAP